MGDGAGGPGQGSWGPPLVRGPRKAKIITGVVDFDDVDWYPAGGIDFSSVVDEFKEFKGVAFGPPAADYWYSWFAYDREAKKVQVGYTDLTVGWGGQDIPAIAAGASYTHSIDASGYVTGENVSVTFRGAYTPDNALVGLIPYCRPWLRAVGAQRFVDLTLFNPTAGAINPPATSLVFSLAGTFEEMDGVSLVGSPPLPFVAWGY